jgi:hypothetical protein
MSDSSEYINNGVVTSGVSSNDNKITWYGWVKIPGETATESEQL